MKRIVLTLYSLSGEVLADFITISRIELISIFFELLELIISPLGNRSLLAGDATMITYKQPAHEQRCQIEGVNKSEMIRLGVANAVHAIQTAISRV